MRFVVPTISMWQPWASWVMWEWKGIETRLHRRFISLGRCRIGIHAARQWDPDALRLASKWLTEERLKLTQELFKPEVSGAFLGTAFVEKHQTLTFADSEAAMIDCTFTRRYGLYLSQVTPGKAIPLVGRQGIFYVEVETDDMTGYIIGATHSHTYRR